MTKPKTYWAVFEDEELATNFMNIPILGETKDECMHYKSQYLFRKRGILGSIKITVRKVQIVEVKK